MTESGKVAFVSYGQRDKDIAETVCAALEEEGVSCWIAPRDIDPGETWANAIIEAIRETSLMVLVLSEHSNNSQHVAREVDRAINDGDPVFLFRTQRVVLSGELEYYLATHQYVDVDATRTEPEQHVATLVEAVNRHLSGESPIEPESGRKPVKLGGRSPVSRRAAIVLAMAMVAIAGAIWAFDPFDSAVEPRVALTFAEAPEFSVNRNGEVRFRLENTLATLLTDVRVSSPLPVGLLSESGTETLELFRGNLKAHETVDIVGVIKAGKAGEFIQTARVEVKGQRDAEADWQILAVAPRLSITLNDVASVPAGEIFSRTIEAKNESSVPVLKAKLELGELSGLELLGSEPPLEPSTGESARHWTVGDLAAGQSKTVEVKLRAIATGKPVGRLEFTADDGRVSAHADLGAVVEPPKLHLTLSGPADADTGDSFSYELRVRNQGTTTAHGVSVVNKLPWKLLSIRGLESEAFDVGELPPGEERRFTLEVRSLLAGPYVNTARLRAVGLNAESNTVHTTVADLPAGTKGKLSMSVAAPTRRYLGRQAEVILTIQNHGPGPSRETLVQAALPKEARFVAAAGGGHFKDGMVTWMLGTLPAGATHTVSFVSKTSVECVVPFKCRALGFGAESAAGEAKSEYLGIPLVVADVIVTENPIQVGGTTTIIVTATNQGSGTARNIAVKAELPSELEFVTANGPTVHTHAGHVVLFQPVAALNAKTLATWRVQVKAITAATSVTRVSLNSDDIEGGALEYEARVSAYE